MRCSLKGQHWTIRTLPLGRFASSEAMQHLSTTSSKKAGRKVAVDKKLDHPGPRRLAPTAYQSFTGTLRFKDFEETYQSSNPGEVLDSVGSVSIAGRIVAIRNMGKLIFITLRSDNRTLQVVVRVGCPFSVDELKSLKDDLRCGDVVGCSGQPGRSKTGELSLYAASITVLAPYVSTDLIVCPDQRGYATIQDPDLRYRYRFIDMITNAKTIDNFKARHRLLSSLRNFLSNRDFIEVETPIFHPIPGGASAKPFITTHHASDSDLYLRVAPELYLKQCIVGGLERVFEVGRVFRNEDTDRSHNPEFTSCEFYQAYATYRDVMPLTEALLRQIAMDVNGSTRFLISKGNPVDAVWIDLAEPFRRVSVVPELERCMGVTFPSDVSELDSAEGVKYLESLLVTNKVSMPVVRTASKLVDKLIEHFITDHVTTPTFVLDHPVFMSPLAKAHPDGRGLSERFELFINGMEICNAYSELCDPEEQFRRFEHQMRQRDMGDDESLVIDDTFLKALQVGLPPTAGWGMGIDRMLMLLTGSSVIRDVVAFPLLRPDCTHDAKRRARTASFFGFDPHMTSFVLRGLEAELERRGEVSVCSQLRRLRNTMDEVLKRAEYRRQGRAPRLAKLDALLDLMVCMMCPPPMR